jgi:pimeloyl-ACP methyl ester carboxylesterase
LKKSRVKFWMLVMALSLLVVIGFQAIRHHYIEEERQARIRLRETIKQKYPEKVNEMYAAYGIKPANGNGFNQTEDIEKPDVILVHGLDEPGKVWMNLEPILINDGFNVWIMTYPNDQPIVESAQFFLEEMIYLKATGRKTVSIVAHSMGGLVAREMLTSPSLAYSQNVLNEDVPRVAQLIMVGTPNGGSELARFRIFTEFRDQFANLLADNYSWLQGILDGAGEAGLDLIPSSPFLETLNSRPHPKNTDLLVVAGVMGKWGTEDIEKFIHTIKARLPGETHDTVAKIGGLLNSMAHGLGDGLVSVDSAKLDGAPLRIVQGSHLTIIRNISVKSQRIPPAVPIIVEYLTKGTSSLNS